MTKGKARRVYIYSVPNYNKERNTSNTNRGRGQVMSLQRKHCWLSFYFHRGYRQDVQYHQILKLRLPTLTWPFVCRVETIPVTGHVLVHNIIAESTVKFWPDKVHAERVPEWSERIAFFGAAAVGVVAWHVTESCRDQAQVSIFCARFIFM